MAGGTVISPTAVLDQRLAAAARVLLGIDAPPLVNAPGATSAHLLPRLVDRCTASGDLAELWLLLTSLGGALPSDDELRAAARCLELARGSEAEIELLDIALGVAGRAAIPMEMEIAINTVVVDVNFCARHDIHTGIQRVVRETVPRWSATHEVLPVAWTDEHSGLRTLRPSEVAKVFAYSVGTPAADHSRAYGEMPATLVVPWNCVVAMPEIPEPAASPYLAALAQYSRNRLVAVGYDMIPIVSADLRPGPEATRFTQYLNVIKHADRVAGISRSSVAEFRGFADALAAQGLPGPAVTEVVLPAAVPDHTEDATSDDPASGRPQVLCIGTHDPHKNHLTVVHAAERLWREGLDFELVFVGGRGWRAGTDGMCLDEAAAAGRPVRDLGRVNDAELSRALRSATFTVFISLHEGFGLPVAESLAAGTPAITSDFGSLREIAEQGGCLTVDPRNDDAVTAAMRRLLTDPAELARLRAEAARRPERTWDAYAAELWDALIPEGRP